MNLPYVYISLSLSPLTLPLPITTTTHYIPYVLLTPETFFSKQPHTWKWVSMLFWDGWHVFCKIDLTLLHTNLTHSSLQWNLVMAIQLSEVEISCFSMLNSHTKWQSGIHKQSPACICTHTPPASSKALTSMANISSHMLTTEGGTPLAFDRMFAAKHANGHARINFSPRIWNFATGASRSVSACVLQLGLL